MRKGSFITGMLCGGLLFGSLTSFAISEMMVKLTSQIFFWNDEAVELEAYNINGYNYIRLRDAAQLFGIDIEYCEDNDSVYLGEHKNNPTNTMIDRKPYARKDFSQEANPNIFDEIYTRDAYNTMRQSIADMDTILAGNDESGYNPNYHYAHFVDYGVSSGGQGATELAMESVAAHIRGYYTFEFGYEPDIKNIYEYFGYNICKLRTNTFFEPANKATDSFIEKIKHFSEEEKITKIANEVCDRIVYKDENVAGINQIFTSASPVNGICGSYSNAFLYLCQRAGIPCVKVQDDIQAWNEVYCRGSWWTVDVGYYDVSRPDGPLLQTTYFKTDMDPKRTAFAKELLVPGCIK